MNDLWSLDKHQWVFTDVTKSMLPDQIKKMVMWPLHFNLWLVSFHTLNISRLLL